MPVKSRPDTTDVPCTRCGKRWYVLVSEIKPNHSVTWCKGCMPTMRTNVLWTKWTTGGPPTAAAVAESALDTRLTKAEEDARAARFQAQVDAIAQMAPPITSVEKREQTMARKKKGEAETNGHTQTALPGAEPERVEKDRRVQQVGVRLNTSRLPERMLEMSKLIREGARVREEKREANAKYREQLAGFNDRLGKLAEENESGLETVDVEVVEWLITRTNTIEVRREDTGELVSSRAATAADMQPNLPFPSVGDIEASEGHDLPDVPDFDEDETEGAPAH